MTEIHIIAGLLALLAGAVALAARKGSYLHRRSGIVFVGAMIALTTTAFVIAAFMRPNRVNATAALMTFYFVCTALLTVRRQVSEVRWLTAGLAILALGTAVRSFALGFEALDSPGKLIDDVPAQPLFLFAIVGTIGGLLDFKVLRAGAIEGAQRLARHLWRMTFAMWTATTSFFFGQMQFLPEPLRKGGLVAIPVLLVLGMLFYWLFRVLFFRKRPLPIAEVSP